MYCIFKSLPAIAKGIEVMAFGQNPKTQTIPLISRNQQICAACGTDRQEYITHARTTLKDHCQEHQSTERSHGNNKREERRR